MDVKGNAGNDILHVSFNQDQSCFAVGTQTGFYVCDTNPMNLRFLRQFDEGIGIVEMLFRSNIMALVGGGHRPRFPPNSVMIWDDHQEKKIAELEFRSPVKAVKLRRDRIVVALDTKVYVYNFEDLRLLAQLDAVCTRSGLLDVAPSTPNLIMAFQTPTLGEVCWYLTDAQLRETKKAKNATEGGLEQLALDPSGTRLAVTSDKGTLIRILNLQSGTETEVNTYRRGTRPATIQCLVFSADSSLLACTSDHGTIHVFHVTAGATSSSGVFGMLIGANEPRAVAHHKLPETLSICAFVPSPPDENGNPRNILLVLASSGRYYTLEVKKSAEGEFSIIDLNNGQERLFTQ